MLSLGNLAVGQSRYYLEQAHGSVTRAGAVSSGVEDYYLGGHEAPGAWMGTGAAALGLAGSVAAVPLDRVLCGEHPGSGPPLGRVLTARRPGFDLTFSAPKSVSVLFGVGDDALREALRNAHDRAVVDALGYMKRHAAVTRRGAGGVHAIAGSGLVAAAFRHRTSRAGDPHLHTHVLVANLTLGADGQWSTLDGRRIYTHAKTAGYLYEARLRAELTCTLGVDWTPPRNGIADIAGVPPAVLRAFSRRRAEIEAELQGLLSFAVAEGKLETNPAREVKKPSQRSARKVQPVTPETVEELRDVLRHARSDGPQVAGLPDATIVSLLAYGGLRTISELRGLEWTDVGAKSMLIHVSPKTGATRTVRLLAPLSQDLAEWRLASGRPRGPRALVFALRRRAVARDRLAELAPATLPARCGEGRPGRVTAVRPPSQLREPAHSRRQGRRLRRRPGGQQRRRLLEHLHPPAPGVRPGRAARHRRGAHPARAGTDAGAASSPWLTRN